ncbi:twin-arginine translocation signal domain-containing protein [Photobacterium sp. SDRW27]|uniref:4Fe-4S dicluster domain-containing protein n=1 Tax=Photobacterium obscurum TaxID=2829490 RepID=UPI0022448B45|nr:reductive dehalogenase domain-containing protein [Photobacterium obscurum]MCW8329141.1 twin-arginine translocation signal domain-containing protein [Photobacterium obscurum]
MKKEKDEETQNPSRRNFLKIGGAAAAAATVGVGASTGFVLGREPDQDTGWGRTAAGKDMFFDREPFRVDTAPTLIKAGKTSRPEREDFLFKRLDMIGKAIKQGWNPADGWESCPDLRVVNYYRQWPKRWPEMMEALRQRSLSVKMQHKYIDRYVIAHAYDHANNASMYGQNGVPVNWPLPPEGEPDVADFKSIYDPMYGDPEAEARLNFGSTRAGGEEKAIPVVKKRHFKTPAHATKLIKKVAHQMGCSFVGITKMDPDFVFKNIMRGTPDDGENWGDKIPEHWKSVIVLGVPMSWDAMYAAPAYGTSYEAYSVVRFASGKLEVFLNRLGWAGRAMVPGGDYEMTLPPLAVKAGLGESARNGCLITPEVGPNIRLACVVTDLEFEYDKPIDIGIREFCKECKICATSCPSGSISMADEPDIVVRGYKVFEFNQDSCFRMWSSLPSNGQQGCRVCVSVCPYTRRNNWIHALVKEADPRDPTGMTRKALLAMQHNFFYYPDAEAYAAPHNGGRLANYHQPPEWLRSEEFFTDIKKDWEYDGNWEGF